jgi:hypothetical protein
MGKKIEPKREVRMERVEKLEVETKSGTGHTHKDQCKQRRH